MNHMHPHKPDRPIATKIVFGLSLIAVGVAFFLDRMGIADADHTLRFWPMLLVIMGATKLFTRGALNLGGHVLILVGAFLQLALLGHDYEYHLNLLEKWWPLGLVWIGLVLIGRAIWPQYASCPPKTRPCCQDSTEKNHEHER